MSGLSTALTGIFRALASATIRSSACRSPVARGQVPEPALGNQPRQSRIGIFRDDDDVGACLGQKPRHHFGLGPAFLHRAGSAARAAAQVENAQGLAVVQVVELFEQARDSVVFISTRSAS